MRGFGMAEMHWAVEQHMDRMAHELGLDPVQIRLVNCIRGGQETLTGMVMHPNGVDQCIGDTIGPGGVILAVATPAFHSVSPGGRVLATAASLGGSVR